MNTYLFNVQTSWEIKAESEDEAFDLIPGATEAGYVDTKLVKLIDQDVMLVEVIPDKSETPNALP